MESNCVFCGQPSSLLCQRCYESYCSVRCQMLDWPKHKLICTPMPQLIPKQILNTAMNNPSFEIVSLNNLSQLVMQNTQQLSLSNSNQIRSKPEPINFMPMRRPRSENGKNFTFERKIDNSFRPVTSTGAISKSDVEEYNERNLFKSSSRATKINYPPSTDFNKNKLLDRSLVEKTYPKSEVLPQIQFDSNLLDNSEINLCAAIDTTNELTTEKKLPESNKMKEKKSWKSPFEIPKEKFFDAIVQHYDSNNKIAWVTDSTLVDNQFKLLRQIQTNLKTMTQAAKNNIFKDALYAAKFEDLYYRAICLEEVNSSNQVKVRLIDYGNVLLTDYQDLKLPIEIMNNLPSYAFCIYYPNQLDEDTKIKIKIFNKIVDPVLGDIYIVEEDVNGKSVKLEPISKPIQDFFLPTNHTLSSLPDEFDVILINFIDNENKNTAILRVLQEKVQNKLDNMNDILNSEKTFDYDLISAPKKGDFIVGRCGKFWKRGIVIDNYKQEFLIFFTDYGQIKFVEQVKQIPSDYKNLPHQIALIDINEILIDKKKFFSTRFIVDIKVKIKNFIAKDSISKCHLFDEDGDLAAVTLKNFEGDLMKCMQNNLWYILPVHRNIVRITNVIDHCTIHIVEESICDSYRLKINAVGKQLEEEFKLLQQNPDFQINSIVLVKRNTTEYHRCRILNLENTEYVVEDIDSGQIITVKNDAIFAANDLLKLMPVASFKYTLNILNKIQPVDAQFNQALYQLKSYCEEKKNFILKIEEPIEEGVTLSPIDNEAQTINKTLIPLLFQKINQEEQVFQQKDIAINSQKTKNIVNTIAQTKLDEETKNDTITKYFIKDIEIETIKCGDQVELLILDNSELKRGIITAGNKDLKFMEKLLGVYQHQINKYCNDPTNGADYLPETDELCLAIFDEDGQWYRAYCMNVLKNGKANLMFFDFGNVIIAEPKKIRKIDKSFLYKSLANTCFIEGFPDSPDAKKVDDLADKIFKPLVVFTVDSIKQVGYCEYTLQFNGIQEHFQ